MPLRMDEGWNQIQFNLVDFTKRAYGTNYVETLRVQVHANCRLRRIYFSDRLYSEEELPPEFKLYLPMQVRDACIWTISSFIFFFSFLVLSTSSLILFYFVFWIKSHLVLFIMQKSWKCCGRKELGSRELDVFIYICTTYNSACWLLYLCYAWTNKNICNCSF